MVSKLTQDKSNNKSYENNHNNNSNHLSSPSIEIILETNSNLPSTTMSNDNNHRNNNNIGSNLNTQNKVSHSQSNSVLSSKENWLPGEPTDSTPSYSSKIWDYAIRIPQSNYSICNLCPDERQISTNNGSTSSLRNHLINKHDIHALKLPIEKKKKINQCLVDPQRKSKLHKLLINCVIKDGRTFNDLQKPGMKNVLQELLPEYTPPSRFTIARHLQRLHLFHRQKLIDELKVIDRISITLDFWSNKQMKSFLVITGHYFESENFNFKSTVLHFSSFKKRHTSVEISRILQMKLNELGILHKVVCVTADGARNMVGAIEDIGLGLKRVWCIAHRLHLTVTNALGFWITKKKPTGNAITVEQAIVNDTSNIEEEHMESIEEFEDDYVFDDISMDTNDDIEFDDNERVEDSIQNNEDLSNDVLDNQPWDIVHEEILDNWTVDVEVNDSGIVQDQEMVLSLVKKCRRLILLIKRSTIITSFVNQEKQKSNIKRSLCFDVKSRWNSTYSMIDSFLVFRDIIQKLFNYKHTLHIQAKQLEQLSNLEISGDNWIALSTLRSVFETIF
ncbi:unnamed protein product [Adineta steineri]|uniref:BED-type domain-containing protein n=1 Tax=Adineta steineri TaxID=433720 RepID=A0A814NVE6_9BILA|nr:unnamed protein product [Adineta steineri]